MSLHVALAMTGASGAPYGLRLLECLLEAGCRITLMISKPAQVVIGMETDLALPSRPAEMRRFFCNRHNVPESRLSVYGREEWTAPVASGSAAPDAMVVCPCTTATVSALATGASRSLIERAGDVMLKERKPLLLVVRETPLSAVHLQNMLTLAHAGTVIMPASPGFYHRPNEIGALVDFIVARILIHLGLPQQLVPAWGVRSE